MGETRQTDGQRRIVRAGDVLFGADDLVTRWVSKRIPGFRCNGLQRALGIIEGEDLVAGVVYDNYNGIHCEASIAADRIGRWASRRTLHTIFAYPFIQLDCQAISVVVPSSNIASLNLATKLGFEPEAIVRFAAHDGSSLVILKMLRETCKWVLTDGKEGWFRSASARSV